MAEKKVTIVCVSRHLALGVFDHKPGKELNVTEKVFAALHRDSPESWKLKSDLKAAADAEKAASAPAKDLPSK